MTAENLPRAELFIRLPRPNLGPEPWPSTALPSSWWLLGAVPLLAGVWWLARRRNRLLMGLQSLSETLSEPLLERDRLLALADRIREALSKQFGASWSAKTTEEIAEALTTAESIEPIHRETLVRLLNEADRAKFAGVNLADLHFEDFKAEVDLALASLAPLASKSIKIGR